MLKQLYPRIFKFWALHLVMIVVGMLAMAVTGPIQSAFSPQLASGVSLALSLVVTAFYCLIFVRASQKLLRSVEEGILFSLAGALPMFLVILGAIIYLQKVPHNTIGYGFILLPVTLPFQGWIEYVYPALPFHILGLTVPAAYMAAVLGGSLSKPKR